mgnify:CR=1 FL=1
MMVHAGLVWASRLLLLHLPVQAHLPVQVLQLLRLALLRVHQPLPLRVPLVQVLAHQLRVRVPVHQQQQVQVRAPVLARVQLFSYGTILHGYRYTSNKLNRKDKGCYKQSY